MGALTKDELDIMAMDPTWKALDPMKAFQQAITQFCLEELPAGVQWSAQGMTAANLLCCEFRNEIWSQYVPTVGELLQADRQGRLNEKIKELNDAFARGE